MNKNQIRLKKIFENWDRVHADKKVCKCHICSKYYKDYMVTDSKWIKFINNLSAETKKLIIKNSAYGSKSYHKKHINLIMCCKRCFM